MTKLITVIAVLFAGTALASTPDGQTPAEETYCDDQSGAAFGICNAYCEAMDCGDPNQHANDRACERKEAQYLRVTGNEMPTCGGEPPPPPPTCEDQCEDRYTQLLIDCTTEEPPTETRRLAVDDGCGDTERCEAEPTCEEQADIYLFECYDDCAPTEECAPIFAGYCEIEPPEDLRIDYSFTNSCDCEDAGGVWVPEQRR